MSMKATLILVCAAVAGLQEIPDRPEKLKFPPLDFRVPDPDALRLPLKNGMVFYAVEDRTLPKVDLAVYLRAGSFWEPRGKEGLAAMTGAVMRSGGTASRSPEALDEQLDFLAARLEVGIGDTQATASLSVLSKELDEGLAILADVLANPAFRQDKIDLQKAQTMERLRARNDDPRSIEAREVHRLVYGDYPVNSHPTKSSVDSISREDLIAFHRRFIHPSRMIVAAAGDFARTELAAKLEKAFATWPFEAPPEKLEIPSVTHDARPGVYAFPAKQKVPQGRVTIAHRCVELLHPDAFPLRVLDYILGRGGFSSRLMDRVRTREGLSYDVHSAIFLRGVYYPSMFRMAFQSKNETCLYAAWLCMEELKSIREEGVSEVELKSAIAFYLDAFPGLFFGTPLDTAQTFATAELYGVPKDYYHAWRSRIAAVTAADVLRVAREHLQPEKLVFVFVGDLEAMRGGDGKHPVTIDQFGPVTELPLPDPLTLERPAK